MPREFQPTLDAAVASANCGGDLDRIEITEGRSITWCGLYRYRVYYIAVETFQRPSDEN